MKTLYLRIYATVVVVLLLFAVVSGWVLERHLDEERVNNEQVVAERLGAWAALLRRPMLPPSSRRRRCATGRSGCAFRSPSPPPTASGSSRRSRSCAAPPKDCG